MVSVWSPKGNKNQLYKDLLTISLWSLKGTKGNFFLPKHVIQKNTILAIYGFQRSKKDLHDAISIP